MGVFKTFTFNLVPKGASSPLLYLKARACSTFNNHAYIKLVERLMDYRNFRIPAHPSNRFCVCQLLAANQLAEATAVTYFEVSLFDPEFSP